MNKKLYKSNDRVVSGVAGGIAEYFEVDKTIIRIVWLVLVLFFGVGFLPYIICAVVMPGKPSDMVDNFKSSNSKEMSEERRNLLGIGLVCLGAFFMFKQYMPYNFMLSWKVAAPLALVAIGVYLLKKDGGDGNE
ncbi:MAG: PspC domain-containing protein [Acidaminobacteraceae bacterium]